MSSLIAPGNAFSHSLNSKYKREAIMILFKKPTLLAFSFFSVILILQGCTVAYYKTDDELNSPMASINHGKCNIKYLLSINAPKDRYRFGKRELVKNVESKYINSTEKVLNEAGCYATQASSREEANFMINVRVSPFRGSLPQEWLTGLSYGAIPSWGTRPNVYTYTFSNIENGSSHEYSIDNVSFNHLVLFPVFWVTYFTLDENKEYENALENFIENS